MAIEHYLQSQGRDMNQAASEVEQMEMQIRILQDHICWLEGEIKEAHHEKELILQKIPPYPSGSW
ncbi:MAG TPA: hypothetical protein VE134_02955 [Methanomicrobiales archaeon]|nr:hypothetical protein [Methanomicrobiales archaeon]